MPEENKAIDRRWMEVINEGEFDAVYTLFAPKLARLMKRSFVAPNFAFVAARDTPIEIEEGFWLGTFILLRAMFIRCRELFRNGLEPVADVLDGMDIREI
jgi:hypothetical protein